MSALCGGDDLLNITEDGEYISEVQRNTITLLASSSFNGGVARSHAGAAHERRSERLATLINGVFANRLQYYL